MCVCDDAGGNTVDRIADPRVRRCRGVCARYGGIIQRKENGLQEEGGLSTAGESGIGDVARIANRNFNVDEADSVCAGV